MSRFAAAFVALAATSLVAQEPAFKARVELVRVPVSVTRDARPVEDGLLTLADFRLTEDGVPQQITLFERESQPLSVCVVLDASDSMSRNGKHVAAVAAMRQMVTRLLPEDELSIIVFADKPRSSRHGPGLRISRRSNLT